MATFMDLKGTSQPEFAIGIGLGGIVLKNTPSGLHIKNKADTNFLDVQARYFTGDKVTTLELLVNGNVIELNADADSTGFNYKMSFARPSVGMSADVTYTFPAAPSNGYFLTTDASGNLSWAAVSSPSVTEKVSVDYSTIDYSTPTGPSSMFTLPANAVILKCEVIVDTSFDGSPTLEISGLTSGTYMYNGQNDLTDGATTKFVSEPVVMPLVGSQQINIIFNAGGSTQGNARVFVHHVIPAP